jgi:hypothetical protein
MATDASNTPEVLSTSPALISQSLDENEPSETTEKQIQPLPKPRARVVVQQQQEVDSGEGEDDDAKGAGEEEEEENLDPLSELLDDTEAR